jgi:hypothetical protein
MSVLDFAEFPALFLTVSEFKLFAVRHVDSWGLSLAIIPPTFNIMYPENWTGN